MRPVHSLHRWLDLTELEVAYMHMHCSEHNNRTITYKSFIEWMAVSLIMNGKGGKKYGQWPTFIQSDALKYALLPANIVWKNSIRNNGDLELRVIFVDKTPGWTIGFYSGIDLSANCCRAFFHTQSSQKATVAGKWWMFLAARKWQFYKIVVLFSVYYMPTHVFFCLETCKVCDLSTTPYSLNNIRQFGQVLMFSIESK